VAVGGYVTVRRAPCFSRRTAMLKSPWWIPEHSGEDEISEGGVDDG
jgi:hypothetical protein